jgi:hypothetical protein
MDELRIATIPTVLDEDEAPFVLGLGPDHRACLHAGGAEFRRGSDRCTIEWPIDEMLRLRAVVLEAGDVCYVMASVGPLLNEWWPLLRREGGNPSRPLLSAGVTTTRRPFVYDDVTVQVSISPPGPGVEMTHAVAGIRGGLSDPTLAVAHLQSVPVIKAALLMLGEYRTLLASVPDVNVRGEREGEVPLATILDVADEVAAQIEWSLVGA